MANPLNNVNGLGNQNPMSGLMQQFQQFKQNFNGDPQQVVQQLLNSGRMTQDQFNKLQVMVPQFQQLMGKK